MVVFYVNFVKMILLGVFQGLNHICLGSKAVMFKFGSEGRETVWEW